MSQSKDAFSNTQTRLALPAVVVASLLFALTSIVSSLVVAAESVKVSRQVEVTCDCCENSPAGTLITRLGDHNLTLKNFRAVETINQLQFTVDADTGAVCTLHDDQMDFEAETEFQFRVLADEEPEHDEFLIDFTASLADSGFPEDDLKPLSVSTVIFDVTVRLCDVPEAPDLADAYVSAPVLSSPPIEVHENPVSVSEAASSTTNVPEENSENPTAEVPTAIVQDEIKESTTEPGGTPENAENAHGDPEGLASVSTLPGINAMHVAELLESGTGTVGRNNLPKADLPSVISESMLPIQTPVPMPIGQLPFPDSPGYLLTIGAISIFLMACVATLQIRSRAAARRARNLEDEASAERLQSALNGIQQDEEIRRLKSQLADRDQIIAQLKKELHSTTHDFDSDEVTENDIRSKGNQDSWDCRGTKSSSVSPFIMEEPHVPSLQQRDTTADVRTSLGSAFERIGQELACESQAWTFPVRSDASSAELLCESPESAVETLDDPQDLRSELADLFAMHAVEETQMSTESFDSTFEVDLDSAASQDQDPPKESIETSVQEVSEKDERGDEDLHLDSVKLYLSKLLERSQDATTPEAILMDRRRSTESIRGDDRRAKAEPSRPPVKSYIDAYMSAHGGELAGIVTPAAAAPALKATPEIPSEPPKPRPPVDVQSIRQAMDSFRVVSIQSSENALLSHILRQAKAKIAWRTMMVAGLAGITFLVFLANMKHVIDIGSLNWLMQSMVVLSLVELGLRIHAVMKQRRSVSYCLLPPRPVTPVKSPLSVDDSVSE